ncbi:Tetraspanin/Peripherin [Trypanosoma melophagium]|uniref:Tetraspanin/Peripherin n=1 Tax=Trypanosoma melophagium TaxID=715481 RepID=UPI00351A3429|nr:Tetraspanin/Peripherin [Trypanosoma melophagium]
MGFTSYYDDYYYPAAEDHNSACLLFFRALMMGVNVLLTAGAVSGLAVGLIERHTVEAALQALCPYCTAVFTAYIAAFSALLAFSLVGFLALCTRNVCLRVLYFISLLAVFAVALAVSAAYTLVGSSRVDLTSGWREAVGQHPAELCAFELQFECSGWETLCNATNTTTVTPPTLFPDSNNNNNININIMNSNSSDGVCPVCTPEEQRRINGFTSTCRGVVQGVIKNHMKEVLPIGFSIAVVACMGMIVTCLLQHKTGGEERYIGRYYRV